MDDGFSFETALSVGIDPHRETVEVVAIKFPEEILLDETFANSSAGHEDLLRATQAIASQHGLRLTFGVEDSGNYGYSLARFLVEQGYEVKEVNPRMTNRQRDFYGQDKTDHLDALAAAAIVLRAHDRLPDVMPVHEAVQATRELSRYRQRLVKEQTASLNQLHSLLAIQYPNYKTFFRPINGAAALAFWKAFPTPDQVRAVTVDYLGDFLYEKSHRRLGRQGSLQKAQHILDGCGKAPAGEPGVLRSAQAQMIQDLAGRLAQLKQSIDTIERQLERTIPATGQQLQSFGGLGTALAAVFIGETLDTIRFDCDKDRFASYNGTAPAIKGSGQHTRHVHNWWCNRHLQRAFNQLALNAPRHEPLSKEYYDRLLSRGLDPHQARKRLMRRLSDIVFAMMRDRTAYDPAIHRRKKQQARRRKEESVAAASRQQQPSAFPPPPALSLALPALVGKDP
jgi:transposase